MMNTMHPLLRSRTLHTDMNRFFNDVFRSASGPSWTGRPATESGPLVNAWATEDAFMVESEIPGYGMDDLEITLSGDELTIATRPDFAQRDEGRRTESASAQESVLRRERRRPAFSRTIQLPEEVDADRVSARLVNGVLTVTLPRTPARQPRRIAVQGG